MKQAIEYEAVKKYKIFDGYIKHFGNVSIDNDIPAMLSFFFIQGQLAVPYVRLPWGASHLDPRVHSFWIQSSRTGKSIAWEFVGDILEDIGVPSDMYTSGTDAGLLGSFHVEKDDNGQENYIHKEGLLSGRKALNFDEGSIILNPSTHSQQTVLYLQSACNPVGSNNNKLVLQQRGGRAEIESLVSLWITTYPPAGVKEYVLTKGIFQRVLLYWSHWDMNRRKNVSLVRSESALKVKPKMKITYEDIVNYFKDLEKRMRNKVLEVTETSFVEWDAMDREEQETLLQDSMTSIFTADDNTFYSAFAQSIDEYYELMNGLGPGIGDVVASFIPAMENYTLIFSAHLAMLDEKWEINGEHVSMATEILFDLFRNLISWLEGEVEIGPKIAERVTQRNRWIVSTQACETFELGNKGDKWIKKQELVKVYMNQTGVTRGTAYAHYGKWAAKMYENTKDGTIAYLRLKEEVKDAK